MISTRNVAALVASTCLLTGCGVDLDPRRERAEPESGIRTVEPTPTEDDSSRPPDGMKWVVSETGLRFAVPKTSTVITGSAVDDPDNGAAIRAYVESTFHGVDEVTARLQRTDLLIVGRHRPAIYVAGTGDVEIPNEEELKEEYGGEPGVRKIDTIRTPIGDVTIIYVAVKPGDTGYYKAFLHLRLATGHATLTVTARAFDDATYQVAELIPTLSDLG